MDFDFVHVRDRVLEWRTLAVRDPVHPLIPFFIQWGAGTPHPATSSPPGCTLVGLRLEDAEPDELRRILDRLGISAAVARGAMSVMRLRLACPTGSVEIPVHRE